MERPPLFFGDRGAMKIVIVGTGPAALKAMEAIAACQAVSTEDITSITVVSPEPTAPYSPMFLVSYVTGELTAEEILLEEKHGLSPHNKMHNAMTFSHIKEA